MAKSVDDKFAFHINLVNGLYNTSDKYAFVYLFNAVAAMPFEDFYLGAHAFSGENDPNHTKTIESVIKSESFNFRQSRWNFRLFQEFDYELNEHISLQLGITYNLDFDKALKGPFIEKENLFANVKKLDLSQDDLRGFVSEEYLSRLDGGKCSFPSLLEHAIFVIDIWTANEDSYSISFFVDKETIAFSAEDSRNHYVYHDIPQSAIAFPLSRMVFYDAFKKMYDAGSPQNELMNEYQFQEHLKENAPMKVVRDVNEILTPFKFNPPSD